MKHPVIFLNPLLWDLCITQEVEGHTGPSSQHCWNQAPEGRTFRPQDTPRPGPSFLLPRGPPTQPPALPQLPQATPVPSRTLLSQAVGTTRAPWPYRRRSPLCVLTSKGDRKNTDRLRVVAGPSWPSCLLPSLIKWSIPSFLLLSSFSDGGCESSF